MHFLRPNEQTISSSSYNPVHYSLRGVEQPQLQPSFAATGYPRMAYPNRYEDYQRPSSMHILHQPLQQQQQQPPRSSDGNHRSQQLTGCFPIDAMRRASQGSMQTTFMINNTATTQAPSKPVKGLELYAVPHTIDLKQHPSQQPSTGFISTKARPSLIDFAPTMPISQTPMSVKQEGSQINRYNNGGSRGFYSVPMNRYSSVSSPAPPSFTANSRLVSTSACSSPINTALVSQLSNNYLQGPSLSSITVQTSHAPSMLNTPAGLSQDRVNRASNPKAASQHTENRNMINSTPVSSWKAMVSRQSQQTESGNNLYPEEEQVKRVERQARREQQQLQLLRRSVITPTAAVSGEKFDNSRTAEVASKVQRHESLHAAPSGQRRQSSSSNSSQAPPQLYRQSGRVDQQAQNHPTAQLLLDPSDKLPNFEPAKCSSKRNGIVKAYGANTNQGLVRSYNEDRVSIILNIMKPASRASEAWPKCSFFGVYDGHGGVNCADYLRDNLHQFVIKESTFPWNPKEALRNGFAAAEAAFLEVAQSTETIDRSGSCAIVTLIVGDTCYVANVGDSRAVLSGEAGQKVYTLSRDHKPSDEQEQKRIILGGGKIYQTHATQVKTGDDASQSQLVVGPLRVFPGRLSVSRTFGDIEAKMEKLGGNPLVVVAEPEIKSFKIADDHDFIALASDGVFDRMTSKEVVQSVWQSSETCLADNVHEQCSVAVENVLRDSMNRRTMDNVTVVMIAFNNYKNSLFPSHLQQSQQFTDENVREKHSVIQKQQQQLDPTQPLRLINNSSSHPLQEIKNFQPKPYGSLFSSETPNFQAKMTSNPYMQQKYTPSTSLSQESKKQVNNYHSQGHNNYSSHRHSAVGMMQNEGEQHLRKKLKENNNNSQQQHISMNQLGGGENQKSQQQPQQSHFSNFNKMKLFDQKITDLSSKQYFIPAQDRKFISR